MPATVPEAVLGFAHRLREAGVPVSMVEVLDAMRALGEVDIQNRAHVRAALRTTLIKRTEHAAAFDALFNAVFAAQLQVPPQVPGPHGLLVGGGDDQSQDGEDGQAEPFDAGTASATEDGQAADAANLLEMLLDALRRDDAVALHALARLAVEQHGHLEDQPRRNASPQYYLYRILRQVDLSNLLMRALREARQSAAAEPNDAAEQPSDLDARLLRDDYMRRIEHLRRSIADAIGRRLTEIGGLDAAVALNRQMPIEDVDVVGATPTQLREMRQAIRPLARKLAARAARQRHERRRGHLDVRRTVRRSLSAGGVPFEPAFRRPKIARPELYLLCDLSGSVAEFAEFTIALLTAMSEEFARLHCFAFIDGIDDVTDTLKSIGVVPEAMHLLANAELVHADGHSDYGRVLREFRDTQSSHLAGKATVIIAGDARTNYRDPSASALKTIHERARRIYWLNPERRQEWNSTDSVMDVYAPHCDGVFEVRNLRQLAEFVEHLT